jgi:hypothetical protein
VLRKGKQFLFYYGVKTIQIITKKYTKGLGALRAKIGPISDVDKKSISLPAILMMFSQLIIQTLLTGFH